MSISFSVDGKVYRGEAPTLPTAMWVTVAACGIYDPTRLLVMPTGPNGACEFFESHEIVPVKGGEEFETCPRGSFGPPRRARRA
jgi:hypothetical protein